jgi:hypothetical protein
LLVTSADGFLDEGEEAHNRDGIARDKKIAQDTAFSLLVDRHAQLMYRIAFSLLRNAQDAEDTVQEAFLKLYRSTAWHQMNDEKAFLARTVWRVALDRLPKVTQQSIDDGYEQFPCEGDSPRRRLSATQKPTAYGNSSTGFLNISGRPWFLALSKSSIHARSAFSSKFPKERFGHA